MRGGGGGGSLFAGGGGGGHRGEMRVRGERVLDDAFSPLNMEKETLDFLLPETLLQNYKSHLEVSFLSSSHASSALENTRFS